jgi:hypothetical protein
MDKKGTARSRSLGPKVDFFSKNMCPCVLHVMEEPLQEWIVNARIIILHIRMHRASFLVHEICGENEENIIRFRNYMKSTDIIPLATFSFL